MVDTRIILAGLWTATMLTYLWGDVLSILAGDFGPGKLFGDMEPTLGMYLLIAIIGALLRRRKTGLGMYMEQAQLEAAVSFLGPHAMDYVVNHNLLNRRGNRDRYMSPHGVYPCRGSDRWEFQFQYRL